MTLPAPTIVHRTILLPEAARLVDHLRDAGIDANLTPDDIAGPLGASPISGPVHGVVVANASSAIVAEALRAFAAAASSVTVAEPFCYYCGYTSNERATTCPSCGERIDTAAENAGVEG